MPELALRALACPVCGGRLLDLADPGTMRPGPLGCDTGHRYDVARQGHVTLTARRISRPGDTAAMVAARLAVQGAGVQAPLTDAVVRTVARVLPENGTPALVVDVGGGTGHHLGALASAVPSVVGLVLDSSTVAARRAARVHDRVGAVVTDVTAGFPLRDAGADVVLSIFAPRNGREMARILAPEGVAVVVTPTPAHMAELRGPLGLLGVPPDKRARVDAALGPGLRRRTLEAVSAEQSLSADTLEAMVGMGPNAFHTDPASLRRALAALRPPVAVTLAVEVAVYGRG